MALAMTLATALSLVLAPALALALALASSSEAAVKAAAKAALAATEMAPIRSPGLISRAKAGVPLSGTDCEGRCWNSSGAPSSHTSLC